MSATMTAPNGAKRHRTHPAEFRRRRRDLRRDHIEKLREALSGAIAAMRVVQGRSNFIERGPEIVAGLSPAIKAAEKVLMESRPSTGESSS